jgi:hypothetical protein
MQVILNRIHSAREISMTVQGLGVSLLTALMRSERRRDIDSSWLLFGPEEPAAQAEEGDSAPAWRFAAE